jgi:hypothetical protein
MITIKIPLDLPSGKNKNGENIYFLGNDDEK